MTVISEHALQRAARDLRDYLQDGQKHWTVRSDPEQAILQAARVHLGKEAAAYFPAPVVLAAALTRSQVNRDPVTGALTPDGTVCRWCHALHRASQTNTRVPANEITMTVLDTPCETCLGYVFAETVSAFDDRLAEPEPELEPVVASATLPVRDAINLARRRYQEREAEHLALLAAAAAEGDPTAKARLAHHRASIAASAAPGARPGR